MLHLGLIFRHGEAGHGRFSAHNPARAVGGGAVPVGIAFADADEAAVPHVDGD